MVTVLQLGLQLHSEVVNDTWNKLSLTWEYLLIQNQANIFKENTGCSIIFYIINNFCGF